jgi:TolA-binding protein
MKINLSQLKSFFYITFICILAIYGISCNYVTHRTLSTGIVKEDEDPEPDYNVTLDQNYQDFVTYIFMGNRSESFGAFFNKFYQANADYDEALKDYRTTTIATYNRKLDSLNVTPPISTAAKELLNKVIERCSKIIQYNKSTRFLDDAVLLVGKSYFYMGEYLQADRKFSEFLSKLTKSELSDEALLFLGRTRFKIGMASDGEKILNNLLQSTKDFEIKSEITQELAFNAISKNDYKNAIDYFEQSINYTKDKEKAAEKLYILAKIYTTFDPPKANPEYLKVLNKTTDFDLTFYAKLNVAKSLNDMNKYNQAFNLLEDISGKYRDYPEFKQLIELEIANTLYYEKKYADAKHRYFDIIINYPGTKSAADAYYHLAIYSEQIECNYLSSYINYKKVSETNAYSDFSSYSTKRASTFDKYFTLVSVIKDTAKITLPTENKELQKYKEKLEREKGIDKKKEQQDEQNPPRKGNEPPQSGGKGMHYISMDSVKTKNPDTTETGEQKLKDTIKLINSIDSLKLIINEDSLKAEREKKTYDSMLVVIHRDDSIRAAKVTAKFDAYFQLSELFLYDLNKLDSTLYYLNKVADNCPDSNIIAKALYTIATVYKNQNKTEEAEKKFKYLISNFPNTIFANESRVNLGLPLIEIQKDSSDVFYKNIEQSIENKNYSSALDELRQFIIKYPESIKRAKAIYTIGWIYEYSMSNKDSSLMYYKELKDNYPASEYTTSVIPKLEFYASLEKINDTTKVKDSLKITNDSTKILSDSTKILSDSTKLLPDSTRILSDSTKILFDSTKISKDTSVIKTDTLNKEENGQKNEGSGFSNSIYKTSKNENKKQKKSTGASTGNELLKPKGIRIRI